MTKPNKTFYDDLEEGLQDVLDYKKGKIHLPSQAIEISELPPVQRKPKDIRIQKETKKKQ